jgi:hypothetical protein
MQDLGFLLAFALHFGPKGMDLISCYLNFSHSRRLCFSWNRYFSKGFLPGLMMKALYLEAGIPCFSQLPRSPHLLFGALAFWLMIFNDTDLIEERPPEECQSSTNY